VRDHPYGSTASVLAEHEGKNHWEKRRQFSWRKLFVYET
jgi:hypothetical protein